MNCPEQTCQKEMDFVKFPDGVEAFHCSVCLLERHLPNGKVQDLLMNMDTGAFSWKDHDE